MQHLYGKPFRAETTLQGTSVIQQVALFPVTFEPTVWFIKGCTDRDGTLEPEVSWVLLLPSAALITQHHSLHIYFQGPGCVSLSRVSWQCKWEQKHWYLSQWKHTFPRSAVTHWFPSHFRTRDGHVQFWTAPRVLSSLKHLCRKALRSFLTTYQVLALPIPKKMKEFLTYRTF